MSYHCVGCGKQIPWDGKGLFAYTCPCRATLFADESGKLALPCSLIIAIKQSREPPHLDYYLGFSNYVSTEKQRVYEWLKSLGAKWSWECPKCRNRVLEMQEGLYPFELHPELRELIKEKRR